MKRNPTPFPRAIPPAPMIVVRPPPSGRERLFRILGRTLRWSLRALFLLVVFLLCSAGITALINESLRTVLLQQLQIGGIL